MKHKAIFKSVEHDFVEIIKAEPNYFSLEICPSENDKTEVNFSPILSWAIERDTLFPYPITLSGLKASELFILHPNGAVVEPMNQNYFAGIGHWLRAIGIDEANLNDKGLR
jgi:hypothetical protein